MNFEKLKILVNKADDDQLKRALDILLKPHSTPVFGAVKVVKHEVAAIEALRILGYLTPEADEYNLVEGLRGTKAKARSLLYNAALSRVSYASDIDQDLREVLVQCARCKDGNLFLFEVAQLLTMGRLRQRIRKYGFLTNGSFSGSVTRVLGDALAKLRGKLILLSERKFLLKKLNAAGFEGKYIQSIIKQIAVGSACSVGGKAGGMLAEGGVNVLWHLFNGEHELLKP